MLTLLAVLFFTGAVWALGATGRLISTRDWFDRTVSVLQCFHVFDVLKNNIRQGQSLADVAVGHRAAVHRRVWNLHQHGLAGDWVGHPHGFHQREIHGLLSGWLMCCERAGWRFIYSWRGQPETVYASQVGDSHVSIPLCIGTTRCITR